MSDPDNPIVENEPVKDGSAGRESYENRYLHIKNLHYHPNDLSELRKIAESNPELADKIVDQRDRSEARTDGSFRLGLVSALVLLVVLILGTVYVVVNAGVIALALMIGVILAAALLIRVVLTGQWSETSWVGKILNGAIGLAGGKTDANSEHDPDDKQKP